jgi:hypothetical protein
VTVIDGGNLFDAYRVARLIRQRTPELDAALGRIHVARSFTCYQTRALLGAAAAQRQPLLALDLLATFGDETVPAPDVQRALQDSIFSLQRLSAHAAVLVSASPAHGANGESLLNCLLDAIPQVIRLSGLDVSAPPPWF